jgi:putative Mg2+ transporter-C (MgtC) family protein
MHMDESDGNVTTEIFDWHRFFEPVWKLMLTYVLTFPIGYDREREGHAAGIRTFPLVGVASCGYILAIANPADPASTSRVMQGLVTGIGFVGGGAIVKDGATVHGTATAAGIWATGAIGAAMAMGRWELAIVLCVASLLILKFLSPVKHRLDIDLK